MKLGLVARADCRGLGHQTWEFHRAMQPDRTLVVDMGPLARGFPLHPEWYPDGRVTAFDGHRFPDDDDLKRFLDGLDVVFSAETPYDHRLCEWARDGGTAVVVQANPEFFGWATDPTRPTPTAFWNPTCWRTEHLPPGTEVVGVPVALDRFERLASPGDAAHKNDITTFLHVVGHSAMADRAGTRSVMMALRRVRCPMRVVFVTQDRRLPSFAHPRHVRVERRLGGVTDYWNLYDGADVLVAPRRYGGLCLPAQEAMAAGLAVVMTDVEPQRSTWPIVPVTARPAGSIRTQAGDVGLVQADPVALAAVMDSLAEDRELLRTHREASTAWAATHSWDAMKPEYSERLEALSVRAGRAG